MTTRFHFWSAGKGLSDFCSGAEPDPFLLVKRRKLLGFHRSIFLLLNEMKNHCNVKTPDGVRQTITVGMATAFEDANRCAELIRKADGALYRAKVAGGDKVAMAVPPAGI